MRKDLKRMRGALKQVKNPNFETEDKSDYVPITKEGTDRKTQARLRAEKAGLSDEAMEAYVKAY